MTKDDLILQAGKPILKPLGYTQLILFVILFCSPIIWIFATWYIAWRIGLSAIIGTVAVSVVYGSLKRIIGREIDNIENVRKNDMHAKKSALHKKIEELQKTRINKSK